MSRVWTLEETTAAAELGVDVRNLRSMWSTPQPVFNWADRRWGPFTLDAAAHYCNAKCDFYYTEADNSLIRPWRGRVWVNPPWSNIDPFIRKSLEVVRSGQAELVCLLVPTRTGQKWWTEVVEPFAEVKLIEGRIPFVPPHPLLGDAGGGFEDAAFTVFERVLRAQDLLKRRAA